MSPTPVVSAVSSSSASRFLPARLSERAAPTFSPQACLGGYVLFAKGGVTVDVLARERAVVTVRGKRSRIVEVSVGEAHVRASCTCSPSTAPFAPCRHVWAALLELDRREAFPALLATRGRVRVEVMASPRGSEGAEGRDDGAGTPREGDAKAESAPRRTRKETKKRTKETGAGARARPTPATKLSGSRSPSPARPTHERARRQSR